MARLAPPDIDVLRSLGYELDGPRTFAPTPLPAPVPPPAWPRDGVYFLTVCTITHLPFARTLVESVRQQHPGAPFVVAVVDAPSRDAVSIDGAIIVTGRDILGAELDYLALKYLPGDFCGAAKPYLIDYVFRHSPAERIVYIDSDICVFAPFDAMIAQLDQSEIVVTPHMVAPYPRPEHFYERPTLGFVAASGVLNNGIFAMRRGGEAQKFNDIFKWLCTAPGAFVYSQGSQAEQHTFNWVTCFADSVHVLRDTAYNVGYFNLHDRSFRYLEEEQRWTVDREPLVAFHFSGFSLKQPFDFSRFQNRYSFHLFPALARIRDFYVSRVHAHDRGELGSRYNFDAFPSGVRIDPHMRNVFRSYEVAIRKDLSPWTPEGEAYYCRALLSPVPHTKSLLPVLIHVIHEKRADLKLFGDPSLAPEKVIQWMLSGGVRDHGYEALFDRHRPAIPTHHGALRLLELRNHWPAVFEGLHEPLRAGRRELLARLRERSPEDAEQVHNGDYEHYVRSPIAAVRTFLDSRPDVRAAFPDFLFAGGPACANWLREKRLDEHFLPAEAIDLFESRTGGGPLARVYSMLARTWRFMDAWPLALVGEQRAEFARALLETLQHTVEYDLADVEMFLWIMDVMPWAGVPLTLELPVHTTRHPSSRSREGQDEILAPLLARDPRFAEALAEYRMRWPFVEDRAPRSQRTASDVSVYATIGAPRAPHAPAQVAPGVNVFGFHRTENGLGQMTRGLMQALSSIDCETSAIVTTFNRMDADLRPAELIRTWDAAKGTNVFVTYVHHQDALLRTVADSVVEGHRNIAYLAWEQREGTHYWKDIFAEYDQVWALSDFAAQSLTAILGREVHSVPCVVDTAAFPPPAPKSDVFTFLFVFDANSSTERKNPEAAVEAFRLAFGDSDRVRLLLKSSSLRQIGTRTRLQRLLAAIRPHRNIELRAEDVGRNELYALISGADCYVSLHRCEGFGYTCAEAMAYGVPVIATGYSGNMHYMNESNSYPVRYREVESHVQEGPFQRGSIWAEPDVEHAAALMRQVFEQRVEAAARGARGRATIETLLSPAAVGARVAKLLGDGVETPEVLVSAHVEAR